MNSHPAPRINHRLPQRGCAKRFSSSTAQALARWAYGERWSKRSHDAKTQRPRTSPTRSIASSRPALLVPHPRLTTSQPFPFKDLPGVLRDADPDARQPHRPVPISSGGCRQPGLRNARSDRWLAFYRLLVAVAWLSIAATCRAAYRRLHNRGYSNIGLHAVLVAVGIAAFSGLWLIMDVYGSAEQLSDLRAERRNRRPRTN